MVLGELKRGEKVFIAWGSYGSQQAQVVRSAALHDGRVLISVYRKASKRWTQVRWVARVELFDSRAAALASHQGRGHYREASLL